MPRQLFEYDSPARFVAGTVGEPGSRTFFVQASDGTRVTSVALEKAQVAVLAERVDELLDEVLRRSGGSAPVPAVAPSETVDSRPLEVPIVEEFRVGTMTLAWDSEAERVVVEMQALGPREAAEAEAEAAAAAGEADAGASEEDRDLLRVRLSGSMARGFVRRALAVVAAGRPPCPFCGLPLDAEGHICPRANGNRR